MTTAFYKPYSNPSRFQKLFLDQAQHLEPAFVADLRRIHERNPVTIGDGFPGCIRAFARCGVGLKAQDCFLDNYLVDQLKGDLDAWSEKWNLDRKPWIFCSVLIGFSAWSERPGPYLAVPRLPYVDRPLKPSDPFQIPEWNIEMQSVQKYTDYVTRLFEGHLQRYIDRSVKGLKAIGYKTKTRPIETNQIEWAVRWTVKKQTISDIVTEIDKQRSKEGKYIDMSSVRKALKRLQLYDLPIREEKTIPKNRAR
jgi:hypothetical protein